MQPSRALVCPREKPGKHRGLAWGCFQIPSSCEQWRHCPSFVWAYWMLAFVLCLYDLNSKVIIYLGHCRYLLVETAYVIDLCRQVLGILGVFGRVTGDIFVKHVKIEDVLESGDAWYIVKKK